MSNAQATGNLILSQGDESCVQIPGWTMLITGTFIGLILGSFLTAGFFILFFAGNYDSPSGKISELESTKSRSDEIFVSNGDGQISELSFALANGADKSKPEEKIVLTREDEKSFHHNENAQWTTIYKNQIKDGTRQENKIHEMENNRVFKMNPFLERLFRKNLKNVIRGSGSAQSLPGCQNVGAQIDMESLPTMTNQNIDESTYGEFVVDTDPLDGDGASILTYSDIIKSHKELIDYRDGRNEDVLSINRITHTGTSKTEGKEFTIEEREQSKCLNLNLLENAKRTGRKQKMKTNMILYPKRDLNYSSYPPVTEYKGTHSNVMSLEI